MPTASGRQSAACALLRSLALLSVACGGAAMAAPCAAAACDSERADRLLNPLTVRPVDLADAAAPEEAATPAGATESLAPLLFLAPRVTSILEDVFAMDPDTGTTPGEMAPGEDAEAAEAPLRSPVAGSAPGARAAAPETDQASPLPKYQRQMYRTDI